MLKMRLSRPIIFRKRVHAIETKIMFQTNLSDVHFCAATCDRLDFGWSGKLLSSIFAVGISEFVLALLSCA